jgi:hypothetical protein
MAMTEKVDVPGLERITFFTGQRLTAPDLAALQRAHRELRWLHNRSLHGWGIGIGLGVTGDRGDSAVTVEPGYGVDCRGREIILTDPRVRTVPAVAAAPGGGEAVYYLVAIYLGDESQKVSERRPGVCLPEGTVRLTEEPGLEWRRPDQLQEGLELILAQAWIQNCQLSRPVSLTPRRYARPSQQPYIAAGQTEVEKTNWVHWTVGQQPIGLEVKVDTSAARFRSTPRYIAHVAGDRLFGQLVVVGLPGLVDATPEQFTLQVLLPKNLEGAGGIQVNPDPLFTPGGPQFISKQLAWHVVWMGIEG